MIFLLLFLLINFFINSFFIYSNCNNANNFNNNRDDSKTKVTTKRKRDNLQEHIKVLEEQNKIMRRALAEYKITPDQIVQKQNTRLGIFKRLFEIFNSGDVLQLTNFLLNTTAIDCLLLTPSLFQELHGRNAAIQFWTLILEAFPDGLWQLSDTAYEENGFVATRFTFTGTKVAALPSDVLLHRWGKFREMMFRTNNNGGVGSGGVGGLPNQNFTNNNNNNNNMNMNINTNNNNNNNNMNNNINFGGLGGSQEAQAATFRELCTHDNVPTTSGPFIPRGQAQWGATDLPETYGMETPSTYLPHHTNFTSSNTFSNTTVNTNNTTLNQTSNQSIPPSMIKTERFSSPESLPEYPTSTPPFATAGPFNPSGFGFGFGGGGSSGVGGIGGAVSEGGNEGGPNPPLSAIMGCPTLKLTGYMTVTFNTQDRINRYIFVWNTASLIGQILGLSNGDLEAMSQYFNTPNTSK